MDPLTIGLGYLAYAVYRHFRDSKDDKSNLSSPLPAPPQKMITFVGTTGVGKSSTANALLGREVFKVGATHGTTVSVSNMEYREGFSVIDTPGLMDDTDFSPQVWESILRSKIVVYIATRQLYRKELEMVQRISDFHKNSLHQYSLALYVNMRDVSERSMPSGERKKEMSLIQQQVSEWIPSRHIVFGSASPVKSGVRAGSEIKDLKNLIDNLINL